MAEQKNESTKPKRTKTRSNVIWLFGVEYGGAYKTAMKVIYHIGDTAARLRKELGIPQDAQVIGISHRLSNRDKALQELVGMVSGYLIVVGEADDMDNEEFQTILEDAKLAVVHPNSEILFLQDSLNETGITFREVQKTSHELVVALQEKFGKLPILLD